MRIRNVLASIASICIVLTVIWLYFKPSGTNALGNRLAEYVYFTNTIAAPDHKLLKEQTRNARNKKTELREFYKKLPWKRQSNLIDYQSEPRSAWHQIDENGKPKLNYLVFWQTARPLLHAIYNNSLQPIALKDPIVHFRCSDAPFVKHGHYHLTKVISVKWMVEKIKERGFKKVIMLACHAHLAVKQNSCAQYVNFYSEIFKKNGLEIEYQCNNIVKDFTLMVYSPLLVSLNSSSFSFMAGVSKNPNDYISCNMGVEMNGKYIKQTQADWLLDPQEPLLHKDVKDYNQANDVIKKL